jgi:Fe-S-cluster containining protein
MWIRSGECDPCGKCCETVNITVVRDATLRQHGNVEELQRYLQYRGIQLAGEDIAGNRLFYALPIPCAQLMADKTCAVHASPDLPLLCRRYPEAPDNIPECSYVFAPDTALTRARTGTP